MKRRDGDVFCHGNYFGSRQGNSPGCLVTKIFFQKVVTAFAWKLAAVVSSPMDIFSKTESTEDSLDQGFAFGDIDMLLSERDGTLIPVAVENGVHVCQQCREQFVDDPSHPLRMVEFSCGGNGVRIGIHSRCVKKAQRALERRGGQGNLVHDMSTMTRARRFLAKALLGGRTTPRNTPRLGKGDEG